jgi:hypothetical protein
MTAEATEVDQYAWINERDWGEPTVPKQAEPVKTITLEKISNASGSQPLGAIYTYTYKRLAEWEAPQRATKALLRDHPDENRLLWKEVK